MLEKSAILAAPDLDNDELIVPTTKDFSRESEKTDTQVKDNTTDNFFVSSELDGSPKRIQGQGKPYRTHTKSAVNNVPNELTDGLRKKFSDMLIGNSSSPSVRNVVVDSSKDRVIARFIAPGKNISCDIELPLDITANDLVVGLNEAYDLGIDISDIRQCYLSCENPVALLKGKRLLCEFGIRDGSLITYYR